MQYLVRHLTRFIYTSSVSESVMEVRMQPLERPGQQCLRFNVSSAPRAKIFAYRDHYGNAVHYFDIPGHHTRLEISVESAVTVAMPPARPDRLPGQAWAEIDALADQAEFTDWLTPSYFAHDTAALHEFARAIGLDRRQDPLTTLGLLNSSIHDQFAYEPKTTRVDSPIDEALRARAGVCQDFAHIMTALLRRLGVPTRYVSGYIAPRASEHDRSADNHTHAWIEAYLPSIGWVGVDPTNKVFAGDRHIAVGIGRDYADVPPTRGVFKGDAGSELSVAVAVTSTHATIEARELAPSVSWIVPPRPVPSDLHELHSQQQQQQ